MVNIVTPCAQGALKAAAAAPARLMSWLRAHKNYRNHYRAPRRRMVEA
jgi:hypothetical protein